MSNNAFGKKLKSLRLSQRQTLREFCLKNGIDSGNYSRMERGLQPPPQKDEIIEKYALALAVKRGSDDWIELFDLAAAARGSLPPDLLADSELMEALPLFFRKLRAEPASNETLDKLVEMVRRA